MAALIARFDPFGWINPSLDEQLEEVRTELSQGPLNVLRTDTVDLHGTDIDSYVIWVGANRTTFEGQTSDGFHIYDVVDGRLSERLQWQPDSDVSYRLRVLRYTDLDGN